MPYEVLNALKYTNLFTRKELVLIAKSLVLYGFRLFSFTGKLGERATEIAVEKNITVYDSSYIALAEGQNTNLFTADEILIERVNLEFVRHIKEF